MELATCNVCGQEHPVATMVTAHRRPEPLPDGAPGPLRPRSNWWLDDAEAQHERHPRSFFIPPAARRHALRPGELIKLGFVYGPHADRDGEGHHERMWVVVTEQAPDGAALGRLANRPARFTGLALGDVVAFTAAEVLTLDYTDAELGFAQAETLIVDAACAQDDRPPDLVVRAAGAVPGQDAWWCVCREHTKGPSSLSASDATDRFPGLAEPLRAGSGLWEHCGGTGADARWRRVPDAEHGVEPWAGFLAWVAQTAEYFRAQA